MRNHEQLVGFDSSVHSEAAKAYDIEHEIEGLEKEEDRLFRDMDEWRGYWDTFVLLCAIANSIFIPLTISFQPSWELKKYYLVADNTTNVVFFADLFVVFNTVIFSKNKEEITDRRVIASNYIRNMFFVDLVSSIPWD